MNIQLFGAAGEVTGSCYSLSTKEDKILVDCGMFQGSKDQVRMNYEDFNFDPGKYDAIILTHAHLDHCGRIPRLVRYGFKGKIYATSATKELAFVIMMDAAKIAAEDTYHENKRRAEKGLPPRKPIYNDVDVKNTMKLFRTTEYGGEIKLTKNISAKFYNAGHILGAASVQLKVKEKNKIKVVVFSGDLGQSNAILVPNFQPIQKADYVFIESTYGDRLHPPIEDRAKELIRIINETYKRGGKLMIPAFAVERAQEILYYLGEFMQDGLIPKMPVYLDSPMAMRATEVFTKYLDQYNAEVKENMKIRKDPFNFPELIKTESVEESKKINFVKGPCIIVAGNGMCSAGRIKHHIRNNIEDSKSTLLFIGYQVQGTLGYWIKKGEKKIKLLGMEAKVNAKIESIDGFSAHADSKGLFEWISNFSPKPKRIFVTHGDKEQSDAFAKKLISKKFDAYVPSLNELIEL